MKRRPVLRGSSNLEEDELKSVVGHAIKSGLCPSSDALVYSDERELCAFDACECLDVLVVAMDKQVGMFGACV